MTGEGELVVESVSIVFQGVLDFTFEELQVPTNGFSAKNLFFLDARKHHPPTWTERMKVAMGAARGLDYLHKNIIIHGNMRTSSMKGLVKWARPFLKDKRLLKTIDPRIANSLDSEQLYWIGRVTHKCL
ncbi:hypothetical protein DKX38_024528 [Salix brachista]|uniref:Protein kinase domain-containing protein n=1 Tax=Salix brachista TaxID=2182728 RepID=A0A5N5JLV3_9ROSI|nr:hypothetical protein DKX38_024528 [Salix brachista]